MLDTSFRNFYKNASDSLILEDSEGVIKHLTHLEELILTSKQEGLNMALAFLRELYDTFKGKINSSTFVSVKIDGAPACIVGINPENKQFFVSTKSIGNVNPKINYNELDVDRNHGHAPGLAKKLKLALRYLPAVIRDGVYQGDFLFDQEDLKQQNIDGEDLITFKPNTITYAVPAHSPLGQRVRGSKIGIIFHTRYSGSTLQDLKKSSDVNVTEFNMTSDAFIDDAKFKDVSGVASFTGPESKKIETVLKSTETTGRKIKWDQIPEEIYGYLNTFINSLIRDGRFVEDPHQEYDNFIHWVMAKGQKAIEGMKTEKGRLKKQEGLDTLMTNVENARLSMLNLFILTTKLEQAKKMFIDKYNSAIKTKQFITDEEGNLKVTAPEGYVAVDHLGNMVKFVDRLEFSKANFSVARGDKFK
jgi:hypothetical protein